jgi:hypothetical protein
MVEVSFSVPTNFNLAPASVSAMTAIRRYPQPTLPILQALVPQPPSAATAAVILSEAARPQQVLLLMPQPTVKVEATLAPTTSVVVPVELPEAPLDLSCKRKPDEEDSSNSTQTPMEEATTVVSAAPPPSLPSEPFPIHRAGSCSSSTSSSTTSSRGSCGQLNEDEKRLKRKEQNKAAAHSYRQRKKSFSDQIETEHERLTQRNVQLVATKKRLEEQIGRMRQLLNQAIVETRKTEAEEAAAAAAEASRKRSMSGGAFELLARQQQLVQQRAQKGEQPAQMLVTSDNAASPPVNVEVAGAQLQFQGSLQPLPLEQLAEETSLSPMPRPRKYTWPMTLTGRERKKAQNKLASRRFRQRRYDLLILSHMVITVLIGVLCSPAGNRSSRVWSCKRINWSKKTAD